MRTAKRLARAEHRHAAAEGLSGGENGHGTVVLADEQARDRLGRDPTEELEAGAHLERADLGRVQGRERTLPGRQVEALVVEVDVDDAGDVAGEGTDGEAGLRTIDLLGARWIGVDGNRHVTQCDVARQGAGLQLEGSACGQCQQQSHLQY